MNTLTLILRAKRNGGRYCLRIIRECRALGLPISLGFAMVYQESKFSNVYGHDASIFRGAGKVTKRNYRQYKAMRGTTRMQGVGPLQLTWWATQDEADAQGGCWKPGVNIHVGLSQLASNIKAHGKRAGIAAYNGSGPAAEAYAKEVEALEASWHKALAR